MLHDLACNQFRFTSPILLQMGVFLCSSADDISYTIKNSDSLCFQWVSEFLFSPTVKDGIVPLFHWLFNKIHSSEYNILKGGETMAIFTGTATALVTPFRGGKIDYVTMGKLVEWQIKEGVDALVVCGTREFDS